MDILKMTTITTKENKVTSTLAKSEDGNIQITYTIPLSLIEATKKEVISKLVKDVEVPGFRKGMAPIDKASEKIPQQTIIEKTLGQILPKAFTESITEYKIKPALYPKFEIVNSEESKDWQIRAVTCEFPEVNLGNYKKEVIGALKAKAIWTPGDDKSEESHSVKASTDAKAMVDKSRGEKEQEVINTLINKIKLNIPKVLIEEEVNNRLANLLERIEKLGLGLESYLASIGKTPESLRSEYEIQSKNTIAIDLILEKVAQEENIKIEEKLIDETIKAYQADPKTYEKINTPEQRRIIASILRRRSALEFLTRLA